MGTSSMRLEFMGWESQWARVQRHAQRLFRAAQDDRVPDAWDDVVNFFLHAHALLDWLVSDGALDLQERRLLLDDEPLSICRDIANAAKHRGLTRPSHRGGVVLVREYMPHLRRKEEWVMIGVGPKTTVTGLADRVLRELEDVVTK